MKTEALIIDGLAVYADKSGIVFSCEDYFPDSEEIEHVEAFHAGRYCPLTAYDSFGTACERLVELGHKLNRPCCDQWKAGNW